MKKVRLNMVFVLVLLFAVTGSIIQVYAQGEGAAGQKVSLAASAAPASPQYRTFAEIFKTGGWCMWPLSLWSMAALYYIIRNALMLRTKNLLRADLKPEIENLLAARDIKGTREICQKNPCLMTSVLDAGLERISENDFDQAHVKEAIEEAGNEQLVVFMKPINYLSMIGTVAPLLGLLGTVSGIIKAFANISGSREALAGNIGESLICTASGLVIAIPAMIFYFIYKNNFIKNISTMGRMVGHFMNVYRNAAGR